MKQIHKDIIANFSGALQGFSDAQKQAREMAVSLPDHEAKQFKKWMDEINEAVARRDLKMITKTQAKLKTILKNRQENGS